MLTCYGVAAQESQVPPLDGGELLMWERLVAWEGHMELWLLLVWGRIAAPDARENGAAARPGGIGTFPFADGTPVKYALSLDLL